MKATLKIIGILALARGAMLFKLGRYDDAAASLAPVSAGDKPDKFAQVFLAMAMHKMGKGAEARELLTETEASMKEFREQASSARWELLLHLEEAGELLGVKRGKP